MIIMTELQKVKHIARGVRKAFEEIEKGDRGPFRVRNEMLAGYCGRASTQLYLACRRAGIRVGLKEGRGHMFNTYKGRIIDVTATQFGERNKVVVRKIPESKHNLPEYHRQIGSHRSAKSGVQVYGAIEDIRKDGKIVRKHLKGG